MTLTDQERVVLKAIGPRLAPISDVIKAVGYPKAATKKILAGLNEKGAIFVHRHDHPQSLTPAQRKLMLRLRDGQGRWNYYNAVSARQANSVVNMAKQNASAKKLPLPVEWQVRPQSWGGARWQHRQEEGDDVYDRPFPNVSDLEWYLADRYGWKFAKKVLAVLKTSTGDPVGERKKNPKTVVYKAEVRDDSFRVFVKGHPHNNSGWIKYNSHSERITSTQEARREAAEFIRQVKAGVLPLKNPRGAKNPVMMTAALLSIANSLRIKNPYTDLVIKGSATRVADGWKIGKRVFPWGRGQLQIKPHVYLDKSTGFYYVKKERNTARLSASQWANEMARLRDIKPRPLHKLYGSRGPTPEQKAKWDADMREWNRLYRHASKMQKIALEEDNEAYRARQQREQNMATRFRDLSIGDRFKFTGGSFTHTATKTSARGYTWAGADGRTLKSTVGSINVTVVRANIAGFKDADGTFHPIRSGVEQTASGVRRKSKKKYKPSAVGEKRTYAKKRKAAPKKKAAKKKAVKAVKKSRKAAPKRATSKRKNPTFDMYVKDRFGPGQVHYGKVTAATAKAAKKVLFDQLKANYIYSKGEPRHKLKDITAKAANPRARKIKRRAIGSVWIETRGTSVGNKYVVLLSTSTNRDLGEQMDESRDKKQAEWLARVLRKRIKDGSIKVNPARKGKRRNPTASEMRKTFAGRHVKNSTLYFPDDTPQGIAKLGKLIKIKLKRGHPIALKNPAGEVWLCCDTRGRLYLGSTIQAPLYDGPARDLGEVKEIEYLEAKPHLGYPRKTIWFHHMGEEGGARPTLHVNHKGELKFRGGDYRITSRGIEN